MASNRQPPKDPPTHSIPLQDLSRPPGSQDIADGQRGRQRSGTSRGRNLLRGRDPAHGPAAARPAYQRVSEDSPTPATRPDPRVVSQPYHDDDATPHSPVEDLGGFQEALGFAGLSFQGETSPPTQPVIRVDTSSTHNTHYPPLPIPPNRNSEDSQYYYPPHENDSTPLTDTRFLQPMSGGRPSFDSGQDRSSFQSVRISTSPSRGGMLGDDLPTSRQGRPRASSDASSGRQRSLSPSSVSPLLRAGSMMRKMSQRVVNLSNEPDMIEQSMLRKASQAVMTEPPLFPAMAEYAHDEPALPHPRPFEKVRTSRGNVKDLPQPQWQAQSNPLKGKTLGIFDADSKVRTRLCNLLVHPFTEPFILVLIIIQTILLAIESSPSVYLVPRPQRWPGSWIDFGLLGLFIIYTLEIAVRIIVSGFIFNADEYSSVDQRKGRRAGVVARTRNLFSLSRQPSQKNMQNARDSLQPSVLRSFTGIQNPDDVPGHSRQQQRIRLARRAFLRHSFNRLDFVAVVSFWISFVLAMLGVEHQRQIYVFRMLSCLRILRLLGLTSGTSVILRSLKKSAPLLANAAFLIGFFWLLFAIVGVQSFKSSLRRACVFFDPDPNGPIPQFNQQYQFCGGQINNLTGITESWYLGINGSQSTSRPKGYICPKNTRCVEQESPYNGTISFDNILQSIELVFVIMSSNTYTDLMYYTTNSDYLAAALFFSAAMVIMSLFLINLLVAVIVSSFQVIREESKTSAFTASVDDTPTELEEDAPQPRVGTLKRMFDKTRLFWLMVIAFGLIVQCARSSRMSQSRRTFIGTCFILLLKKPETDSMTDTTETIVTFALLLEIVARFACDWRNFHKSKRNWVDLGLAIITSVMQIPPIHNSGQPYAWLTLFQILRVYRLVLAVSVTRDLIVCTRCPQQQPNADSGSRWLCSETLAVS